MTDLTSSLEAVSRGQAPLQTDGIAQCESAAGFDAFHRPDTDLVVWRRTLPHELKAWLEQLAPEDLPHLRVLVQPAEIRRALDSKLDASGMPGGAMRDLLVTDIEALAQAFAATTGVELVDIRLERVSHDACWRFHRDFVEARMLTTYLGPATEWVDNTHAEQALQDQRDFQGPLERLEVHDVALFKGCHAGPERGIVHRSPPIADTGQTRLLLCLNKQSAVSPEPWQGR